MLHVSVAESATRRPSGLLVGVVRQMQGEAEALVLVRQPAEDGDIPPIG